MAGCSGMPALDPGLSGLAAKRRACRICVERDPGRIRSAADSPFDPHVASHWAQWLGHPKPKILIVGQDFGDTSYFDRHRGCDDPRNRTNINLHRLLIVAGFAPEPPPRADPRAPIYLTNAILCLKQPPMNSPVADRWVRTCAENHLRPLIELLKPSAVVGMGSQGWRATRVAFGFGEAPSAIGEAAGRIWECSGKLLCAAGHCGPLGLVNRPWARQVEDWERIGRAIADRP